MGLDWVAELSRVMLCTYLSDESKAREPIVIRVAHLHLLVTQCFLFLQGPECIMDSDWLTLIILRITDSSVELPSSLQVIRDCAMLQDFQVKWRCPGRY